MRESIHKYFKVGTIQWMSYPKADPMDSLMTIARDDYFDAIELKGFGALNEKAKEILRTFFYMSSIMLEVVQESINIEVEKIDRFNADEKVKKLQAEIASLKRYEAIAKTKLGNVGISRDTILGLPKSYFEDKHIKVIESIINKIKKDL